MEIVRIAGATRTVGLDQMYQPLPLRDEKAEDGTNVMYAAFRPSPEEIALLIDGQPLILGIMGERWPPVALTVKDWHDDSREVCSPAV